MRSAAFPHRRPITLLRFAIPTAVFIVLFFYFRYPSADLISSSAAAAAAAARRPEIIVQYPEKSTDENGGAQPADVPVDVPAGETHTENAKGNHPIDKLIQTADKDFDDLLAKETSSLSEAAAAYRKRRGRHPPPGFDKWHEFATQNNAVIVEDFWDQIYNDLNPFWALDPALIRREAWDWEMTIKIRNHNASAGSDWFWTVIWLNLTKTIEHLLPDMDIALNAMDEPRLVVPWEVISEYMKNAEKTRTMADPKEVISAFSTLPDPGEEENDVETRQKEWEQTKPYWNIARRGCPPDSGARTADVMTDFDHSPKISMDLAKPHLYKGYVSNFTLSTDFCHQPDLQGLQGIFVEPLSVKATDVLFPMFGGSKLAVNNEILLPAPMYWNEEKRFTGGGDHGGPWKDKTNEVIWRGVATGGRNTAVNWKAWQRHRFVAMNNASAIAHAEENLEPPVNFVLPEAQYNVAAQREGRLGGWVGGFSNVAFVDLMCAPAEEGGPAEDQEHGHCEYTDPYFHIAKGLTLSQQFDYKYLPDIDGNSFSGRYLGFLRSTSLPLKSTLWREWHDSRLVAWKHFVPMDSRYGDYYGIMEYFLGYGDRAGHDAQAETIATAGREWAEMVLRKEDMQIYVLRLLLEYARVLDEKREKMGWVGDLLGSKEN